METIAREEFDVIVVGAGNAATCAALSARENGARVLMLEIAPEDQRAGNSAFTGGAFRVVYHGFDDLVRRMAGAERDGPAFIGMDDRALFGHDAQRAQRAGVLRNVGIDQIGKRHRHRGLGIGVRGIDEARRLRV